MARRQLQNLGISILKHKQTPSISCESKLGLKFYSSKASDLQIADGTPKVREGRKCVIFARSKTAMSSGNSQTLEGGAPAWRIALETEGKWANPLMGWTSTGDHRETVMRQLQFPTKESAMAFADKMGLEYEVIEKDPPPKNRPKRFPGYGANFDVSRLPGGRPIGGLRSEQQTSKK